MPKYRIIEIQDTPVPYRFTLWQEDGTVRGFSPTVEGFYSYLTDVLKRHGKLELTYEVREPNQK